jgi:hypothetical protein
MKEQSLFKSSEIYKNGVVRRLVMASFLTLGSCFLAKYLPEESVTTDNNDEATTTYEIYKPADNYIYEITKTPETFVLVNPTTTPTIDPTAVPTEIKPTQTPTKKPDVLVSDQPNFEKVEKTLDPNNTSVDFKDDLEMYYPIYKAVEEKFNIPWHLLWIIHIEESSMSKNHDAFEKKDGSCGQYGAMQRHTCFHFDENVNFASKGLESLKDLPQRQHDDWKEISWAAMKLREDWDSKGSLLEALKRYSAEEPAIRRYNIYLENQKLFEK